MFLVARLLGSPRQRTLVTGGAQTLTSCEVRKITLGVIAGWLPHLLCEFSSAARGPNSKWN